MDSTTCSVMDQKAAPLPPPLKREMFKGKTITFSLGIVFLLVVKEPPNIAD